MSDYLKFIVFIFLASVIRSVKLEQINLIYFVESSDALRDVFPCEVPQIRYWAHRAHLDACVEESSIIVRLRHATFFKNDLRCVAFLAGFFPSLHIQVSPSIIKILGGLVASKFFHFIIVFIIQAPSYIGSLPNYFKQTAASPYYLQANISFP